MKVLLPISAVIFLATFMGSASAVTSEVRQPWCAYVDGAMNCTYSTLAACSQDSRTEGHVCIPDPRPPVRR
jgi:hypothetical protein